MHDSLRCPACRTWMNTGYVSVSQGLLWRRNVDGEHRDFAEAIPGTHAIMRANDLPAWRCPQCQLVTMQYGHDARKQAGRTKATLLNDAEGAP